MFMKRTLMPGSIACTGRLQRLFTTTSLDRCNNDDPPDPPYAWWDIGQFGTTEASVDFNITRAQTPQGDRMTDIGLRTVFTPYDDFFRSRVRDLFHQHVKPFHDQWEIDGQVDREVWHKFGLANLHGLGLYLGTEGIDMGVSGPELRESIIVAEEQAYANTSGPGFVVHGNIVMPLLFRLGNDEQTSTYFRDMKRGEKIGAIALAEKKSGGDLQNIETYARSDRKGWVLNGIKHYVTNGHMCDMIIVLAVTNANAPTPAERMSLFVIDANAKGVLKGPKIQRIGYRAQDVVEITFDDVRLPPSSLLGKQNQGFLHIVDQLPREMMLITVTATALSEYMFETTRDFLKDRVRLGVPLIKLPAVQHKLAELKADICVTRALTDESIKLYYGNQLDVFASYMSKYRATELVTRVAQDCLQLHGSEGLNIDSPISKAYADARVLALHGSPNEWLKELIGRQITMKRNGDTIW